MKLNFKGVDPAKNENASDRPTRLDIGVHKVTITGSELIATPGKTPYLNISFANEMGSFNEWFYLTEKSIGRIQSLIKAATGKVLDAEIETDVLEGLLMGKQLYICINGEEYEKDGSTKLRRKFGYADFCAPAKGDDYKALRPYTKKLSSSSTSTSNSAVDDIPF